MSRHLEKLGREDASHENNPRKKLRVFHREATGSAKALGQHVRGLFKDYQGSQCGRGCVHKGKNEGDEDHSDLGYGSCRVPTPNVHTAALIVTVVGSSRGI